MKFRYLGDVYSIPKKTYEFCIARNLLRKLFAEAIPDNPSHERKTFFILSTYDPDFRWFSASSKNPRYYRRFNDTVKHLAIPNLTSNQCKFLDSITKDLTDFRQAIKLSKEAVKTIYEIS
ncbi:hypothetical protein FDJ20_gp112 [Vibrio phage Thalassa]|uniref:Uncharacterized protein n=1 Tax=Vibrio phage Thalassa TaxID=2570301 RepID=A0A2H5BHE8_9CAUD|nr:hypothetical protein FDJ20_gp112 [Vibrio phage Thalassa]AUG85390.1 hypothetical protein THALASSA_211 [Vibrio phage Thalassa]